MRGFVLVAAIGACAMLSSCDQDQQQAAQTAPAAPTCACRPTPPQETAAAAQPAIPAAHHRRHHWRSEQMAYSGSSEHRHWRGDYSRTDFTQSVLASYNYVSQSSVSYVEGDASYESGRYGDYSMHMRGRPFRETIAATMTGARMDPWHGYDVDCPRQ